MKNKSIICLILLLSIACSAGCSHTDNILFSVPMYGAQVTADGEVLQSLSMTITGTDTGADSNGFSSFACTVQFRDISPTPFGDHKLKGVWNSGEDTDCYFIAGIGYSAAVNSYVSVTAALDQNLDSCIVIVDNSQIYVGSTDPDFDPSQLLDLYADYL